MRVVLASASPRRADLLAPVFSKFEVIRPFTEELFLCTGNPELIVKINAFRKLQYVQNLVSHENTLIISADTLVYTAENEILGKPANEQDAIKMLSLLSGKTHYVVTGLSICYHNLVEKNIHLRTETTEVSFSKVDSSMIQDYIAAFQPFDKAGSYGIQELPDGFLQGWKGSFSNVIGLPVEALLETLHHLGVF